MDLEYRKHAYLKSFRSVSVIGIVLCHRRYWTYTHHFQSRSNVFLKVIIQLKDHATSREGSLWVHQLFKRTRNYSEFHHLFYDLLKDDTNSLLYFQMFQNKLNKLIHLIPNLAKYINIQDYWETILFDTLLILVMSFGIKNYLEITGVDVTVTNIQNG